MSTHQDECFGKYRLTEKIGEGRTTEVFEAFIEDNLIAKAFAVKRLKLEFAGDEAAVQLFIEDAKRTALLSHPNIVSCLDLGKIDDLPYAVLEIVPGINLKRALATCRKRHERVPLDVALAIAGQLCEAIEYAHTRTDEGGVSLGIVHGDVEPSHVLLSYEGAVKLTGFGHGKEKPATDIRAVGEILFEMLAGHKFHAETSKIPDAIPQRIKEMLSRALKLAPGQQYDSAGELGREIKCYEETHFASVAQQIIGRFVAELGGAPWEEKTDVFGGGGERVVPQTSPVPTPCRPAVGREASNTVLKLLIAFSALAFAVGFILGGLYQKVWDTTGSSQEMAAAVSAAQEAEKSKIVESAPMPMPRYEPKLEEDELIMKGDGQVVSGKEPAQEKMKFGEVVIMTDPPKATIVFDGQDIPAPTPVTIRKVPLGRQHGFVVTLDGYVAATRSFSMDDESKSFNITLRRQR